MKVTCPISGINYHLAMPARGHAIHPHPMLAKSISLSQLTDWYAKDWAIGELDVASTHLLGTALLLRMPIESMQMPELTDGHIAELATFWASNMERLLKLAARLDGKQSKLRGLPRMVVDKETFRHLPDWLKQLQTELDWNAQPITDKAKELNRASYKAVSNGDGRTAAGLMDMDEVDSLILRALRGSLLETREVKALPVILSDWACKVTDFPHHSRMRWQKLVQTIFSPDYINQILMSDMNLDTMKALEEHLMLNMPAEAVGTSHSTLLMQRLAMVIPVMEDFNPVISRRKKVDADDLHAAIMGDDQPAPKSKPAIDPNAPKKLSLAEMLAARLGKKVSELPQ
jgi:hypothetical protein